MAEMMQAAIPSSLANVEANTDVAVSSSQLDLIDPWSLGLNFEMEEGIDHSRFYDPDLDGLTEDQKSWVVIEKGFKQIKTWLKSIGLEDYYELLMSNGIMSGYTLWQLNEENLEQWGITAKEEKEALLNKRYSLLATPESKYFAFRYGDLKKHWECSEAAVFCRNHIDWPVFADVKENMKEILPTTHQEQWSIPERDRAQYSSEGRWATASSCDGMIMMWPVDHPSATPPCVRCVQAHFDICTDHVTDWERRMTVSVGGDHHITVVDLENSRIAGKIKNDAGLTLMEQFICLDADLTPGQVIMGGIQGQIKVADIQTGKFYMYLKGHEDSVRSLRMDWNRQEVVTAAWDRTIKVWDLRSGSCVRTLHGHNKIIAKMDVSFDLQMAMSCSHEDKFILWDLKHGGAINAYHNWSGNDVCVDWEGMRFASCGDSDLILIWDLEQGTLTHEIDAWDSMNAQCIDVDWKRGEVLLGTWDNQVLLFDIETEEIKKTLKKPLRTVTKVRLNDPPGG